MSLFLPTQYALDLQLLGGLWILQTLPARVFGLFTRWFRAEGLLLGWAAGIGWGFWTAWNHGLKPLATINLGGADYSFYVGCPSPREGQSASMARNWPPAFAKTGKR